MIVKLQIKQCFESNFAKMCDLNKELILEQSILLEMKRENIEKISLLEKQIGTREGNNELVGITVDGIPVAEFLKEWG